MCEKNILDYNEIIIALVCGSHQLCVKLEFMEDR